MSLDYGLTHSTYIYQDVNVYSYTLSLTVIEYQTAVLRGDLETAEELLPTVPVDQRNRIARFLESQGLDWTLDWFYFREPSIDFFVFPDLKELALEVSTDLEHKFELAIQLEKLDVAVEIAREVDTESKWKAIGDSALSLWKVDFISSLFFTKCLFSIPNLFVSSVLSSRRMSKKGKRPKWTVASI